MIQKNPYQPREKGKLIESYRVEQGGQEWFDTTGWRRAYSMKKIPSEMDATHCLHCLVLTLLKRITLLDFTQNMNTLFYFDCLGHQELGNITH